MVTRSAKGGHPVGGQLDAVIQVGAVGRVHGGVALRRGHPAGQVLACPGSGVLEGAAVLEHLVAENR
ncbi:hypothetical protein ACWD5Q_31565 [Streptomyces sp. NPDC002513]